MCKETEPVRYLFEKILPGSFGTAKGL